jgi:nitrile hydratase subunit beta
MNGIHDMGGMQGMGPIEHEQREPTFHARWEGRVYALWRVLRARGGTWNLDAFRHDVERLPPADYLRMTYYERWFTWIIAKLVSAGDTTQAEIESGVPAQGSRTATPFITGQSAPDFAARRPTARRDVPAVARFNEGQRARARNINPVGHTRLPRYVRGKEGVVAIDRGVFLFPDTNAHFLGEKPQHLYSVRFAARELWGESASARDSVHVDLWDDYLEPV